MNSRAGIPTYTLSRGAPSANLGISPHIITELRYYTIKKKFVNKILLISEDLLTVKTFVTL